MFDTSHTGDRFDGHDLAIVREAHALLEDLSGRHPFALDAQCLYFIAEARRDLECLSRYVQWRQA